MVVDPMGVSQSAQLWEIQLCGVSSACIGNPISSAPTWTCIDQSDGKRSGLVGTIFLLVEARDIVRHSNWTFWVSYVIARMAMEFEAMRNVDPVEEYVESLKLNMESLNGVKVSLTRA
jgi:hypothetical protein